MTPTLLGALKAAFQEMCKSLGKDGTINSVAGITVLLRKHNFTPTRFVETYTTDLRGN